MKEPKLLVPSTLIDLTDLLATMRLFAPKFVDPTGYMPFINLDYRFRELHAGLDFLRLKLGEERYQQLKRMSDQMRPLFEADPDKKTGQTTEGCKIIAAMEDIVRQAKRKS